MAERKKIGNLIHFFVFIFCVITSVMSTEPFTSIDKTSLTVGERVHFRIALDVPKGTECIPPEPEAVFGPITVKGWNMSRRDLEQSDSIFIDYTLTTYIPENCTIPSLQLLLQTPSTLDTVYTNSIPLQIISVLTGPDSTIDLKELKPQQIAGSAPKWWLWIGSIAVGILLVIVAIVLITKKLKKEPLPPPPIPPYEEAIHALGALHGKRLIEKGLIREYVFELSEIFKRYIERRFLINASEFTTEEMIAWSGVSGLDSSLKKLIEWFFRTTDPVKFAKLIPDTLTIEQFLSEVTTFIEATKPLQNSSNIESESNNTNSSVSVNSGTLETAATKDTEVH